MRLRVRGVALGGISLVLLAVAALPYLDQWVDAAVVRAWVRQYKSVVSNSVDVASAILRDPAGNIIVAGNSEDGFASDGMLLLKYSGHDGSLLWYRRLSGPTNSYAFLSAAAVDARGNIAITGYAHNGEDRDYYTALFSTEGTLLWARSYDGPSDDMPMAVAFDRSGNVVVTGGSSQDEWRNDDDDLIRLDFYTAKYAAADGALLWERRYNGTGNGRDQARAVAVDASDNVVVTGYSDSETSRDYYTAKYAAADGAVLWDRYQDSPEPGYDIAYALALDARGDVIVAGGSHYDGDAHTVKYAGVDGTLLWEQRRSGPGGPDDAIKAVAVDRNGDVIVTGHLHSGNETWLEAYIAKYAAVDGTLLWERFNTNGDSGQSVVIDSAGNVIVAGYAFDSDGWNLNQFAAKYATADGAVLWERLQEGPRYHHELKAGLVLDQADNAVMFGSFGRGDDPDITTAKLATADGAVLWEQRYNGPAHRSGMGEAVVIDAHGNVIVTGRSEGEDSDFDYLTIKYAPNGTMLWERRYNNPLNTDDYPRALALDAQGNAIVTGSSHTDYYTVKYAAANGALLWERRENGFMDGVDQATALALDADGNVLVTGTSLGLGAKYDYFTVKYAADTGALIWSRRVVNPTGSARPEAVAADPAGNVVVTGSVWTGPSNRSDFYTVKYAAADGSLLWDRQYNGPRNTDDNALDMALDGEGNVFVTGSSDYGYTVKYAADTGQVMWEQQIRGFGPRALAVDAHGNAIITGGNTYTLKYAASDGAVLWEKTLEDSPNPPFFTRSLALDPAGNALLSGIAHDGLTYNFFIAKHAALDGALLWRLSDDGPGNLDDAMEGQRTLAIGPNGMVAITGTSGGYYASAQGHDFTTVVYRDTPGDPPQVAITAPANGSQWVAGSTITLAAEVADPDGIVDFVEFFAGDTSLGISSSAPWTVTWANVPAGTHNLTARAMDLLGPITLSTTVTITVTNPPAGPTVNLLATDSVARERAFYHLDTASFIVHRSGSLNSNLIVYYNLGGSASNGADYLQLPGQVTIPAGHRFARIVVVPRKDSIREGREDVRITLRPPPAGAAPYTVGKYAQNSVYIFD